MIGFADRLLDEQSLFRIKAPPVIDLGNHVDIRPVRAQHDWLPIQATQAEGDIAISVSAACKE